MARTLFSTWTADQLRDGIFDAEQNLASLAEEVASPDGTRSRFRDVEMIEKIIDDMKLALGAVENGCARGATRRLNFMAYGRFRRWMR